MLAAADVLDEQAARNLGLVKGEVFFMLHTGSRSVGSKLMKGFLKEWEQKHEPRAAKNGSSIWALDADSEIGVRFARAVAAASNFGFANRIAITEKLRQAVRKVLHDDSLALPLLYDCSHVSIKSEQWNGEKLWLHRHGASYAMPASSGLLCHRTASADSGIDGT